MRRLCRALTVVAVLLTLGAQGALARDWFVCQETGKGKSGTKDKPAKDLGNIATKLEDGDRVFIAEGVYLGRGESGATTLTAPVTIIGGYDAGFSTRDPWGAHKTIFSGVNESKNWDGASRLTIDLTKRRDLKEHTIVVDGIIFDNAERNHYATDREAKIVRTAAPQLGKNPTPETGGLRVMAWKQGNITVRNCIVLNTAPSGGAFSIWGHQGSKVEVQNNLAVNNTGEGFYLHTSFHGEPAPEFTFRHNTALLSEKHDPIATYGGNGLMLDAGTKIIATNNVFGLGDFHGVNNAKRSKDMVLNENLFMGNMAADYLEFDTRIALEDLEDEAELLDEAEGNVTKLIKLPVSQQWATLYNARNVIDRAAAEAQVQPKTDALNAIRAMLGLNVEGTDLKVDSDVWLPRMSIEDAIKLTGIFGAHGTRRLVPPKQEE